MEQIDLFEQSFDLFPSFEDRVVNWAKDRDIMTESTPLQQFGKLFEEVLELHRTLVTIEMLKKFGFTVTEKDLKYLADDIGDINVVTTIISNMFGVSTWQCQEQAWNDIKDRKGKMVKGKFVKEADL